MANRIQIRRGTAASLVGKQVYQGELLWVTDEKKLYIGTTGTTEQPAVVEGEFPKYENSTTHQSVVKVISPDASEVKYDNTGLSAPDKLDATTVQAAIDELATEKQMKLGGSASENGKAIIASSTSGIVTYREIDDTIGAGSDGSNHLVTANAAYDSLHALDIAKQDRPANAVAGNIATFNGTKDTIDSGKEFTTNLAESNPSDNKIPTEAAVRTAITTALTSAVNYRGMCKESELPTEGQKKGDFWSINDFDITYPSSQHGGHKRNGSAIWNGTGWDKEVDEFYNPDETTINLNGNGELQIKPFNQSDSTSTDTPGFGGTITMVDSVTRNGYGQTTGLNVKTVTLPSLGEQSGQAAKGDEAEYTRNKTQTIRAAGTADNTKYPTEAAVRAQLDTKVNKINITASTNYSLVNYNSEGAVISGTPIIDGGSF